MTTANRILLPGLAGMAALCLLTSCATRSAETPAAAAPVWPPPPEAPRITWQRSIGGPGDLGVRRSTLGRIGDWLTGETAGGSGFVRPFGIALDETGNLCLTDTGSRTVCYFDWTQKIWRRWEQAGAVRFDTPVAVAKHGGIFYVADTGLASVVMFDEQGKLRGEIKAGLQRPSGVAVAGNRLLVADSQAQSVLIFGLDGKALGSFGSRGAGEGQFNFPTHISADMAGNLLVTDSLNSRLQVFDPQGRFLRQIGSLGDSPGHFSRPKGVAGDTHGHLYVVDANFDNVQIFDKQGQLLMSLGGAGNGPGQFWLPNGIAVSRDNVIYITDSYNQRIQVLKFTGEP